MKKLLLAIAVLVGVFATTSCQKEELQNGSEESVLQFSASIEPGASTKTTVEKVDGTTVTYKTKWEATDCIKIEGATYQATPNSTDATMAAFTKTSGEDPTVTPYKAYYPASMSDGTTATLPASYTYAEGKFNMPMYAESTNNKLLFKNLCGVLAITVPSTEISTVSSITVVSDKQMNGAFTADKNGVLTFTTGELTDANKQVTMTFSTAKTIDNTTFYIPVPAGTHNPLTIIISNGTIARTMVTKKSEGVAVARNTVYPISFADNQPNILPGLFSVATNKQVRFSLGSLYYDMTVTPAAFRFESKQHYYRQHYSCTAQTPGSASVTESGSFTTTSTNTVGTFRWAANSGTLSTDISSAISTYDELSGSASDIFFTNATQTTPRVDFTVNGETGVWRTLSKTEWNNLCGWGDDAGKRTQTNLFAKARVNGVNGLLIFPDGYNGTTIGDGIAAINAIGTELNPVDFPSSNIPTSTWTTMEKGGCVFLPAAGCRYASVTYAFGIIGCCWSSTPAPEIIEKAYDIAFLSYDAGVNANERFVGISVRLVRAAN